MRLDVGADSNPAPEAIPANPDLFLLAIVTEASALSTGDDFRTFLQSWRVKVPGDALPLTGFQEQPYVERRRSDFVNGLPPRWKFTLYDAEIAPIHPPPRGAFSNIDRGFFASSISDAGMQWLDDPDLVQFSATRTGIDINIWDRRAFISSLDVSPVRLRPTISSRLRIEFLYNSVFHTSTNAVRRVPAVPSKDDATILIPKDAFRYEVFLVGDDGVTYDQAAGLVPTSTGASETESGIVKAEPNDSGSSARPSSLPAAAHHYTPFVNAERRRQIAAIQSDRFDFVRLIALLDELNVCYSHECWMAVAALTRAVLDQVPPVFDQDAFARVVSNYPGSQSFRQSMEHLNNSARKIADAHLHQKIRAKEVVPNRTQVDFSRDLDVLLAEIVRILK
jgi:hypothetical protein